MLSVKDNYLQGQMVKVNQIMIVKNTLKYVGQERCCDMVQLEIQSVYTDDDNLNKNGDLNLEKEVYPTLKSYVLLIQATNAL